MPPVAEVVCTGSELLDGRRADTHVRRIARALRPLGLRVARAASVPDDRAAIAEAVGAALERAELVFVTGGLGPTLDDVTREAVGELLGRAVAVDAAALAALRARYGAAGRSVTPARERQACVVEGAAVLRNAAGAAPGQRIDLGDRHLFVLPGPPRELEALLADHVLPWLLSAVAAPARRERLFMVCGPGEADVAERLAEAGLPPPGVELAYGAQPGRLEVCLSGEDEAALEAAAGRVRDLLGHDLYAERAVDLEEVVGAELAVRGLRLATAESCTGGLLAARITSVSGSSACFEGGVVAYANAVKERELGVPAALLERHGAVSAPVAEAMARGARERFGVGVALSTTGIAGPSGGTDEKPVGLLYVGLADARGTVSRRFRFPGDRASNRLWGARMALDLLRRRLAGCA